MSKKTYTASTHFFAFFRNPCGLLLNGLISLLYGANRVLLSATLSLWLIDRLSKAWERFGCAQQFHADWGVALLEMAIAAAIVVLLMFTAQSAKRQRRLFALETDWTKLLRRNWFFCGFHITYLLASCTTFLIFSVFFAKCTYDNSAKGLACLMSDVGQYELAERLYLSAPDLNKNKASGRFSSMAAWHSSSTHEDPKTLRLKNAAVAAVYGSESRQMAGRYFYLGLTCEHGRENEAIYWFNKAKLLYEQNHAITKCMDALAQMAIIQDSSNKQESKRLIAEAARLSPSMDEEPYISTPIIQYCAQRNGDKEQAELLSRSFKKSRITAENDNLKTIVLITSLAVFGSGLGCLFAKEQAVALLSRQIRAVCLSVVNPQTLMESLNELITLNLIQRNLQAAERNSLLLLALATGHRSVIVARQDIAANGTRLAPALRGECNRVFLALAIAWSFYL